MRVGGRVDMLNVPNRSLFIADNLPVLRSMDSNSVDLVYLDPPFNTGRQWANPIKAKGKKAIASFEDTWRLADIHVDEAYALGLQYPESIEIIDALHIINGDAWKAYLIYMGIRLMEIRRVLKDTGSVYFHCDPTMSHGVKLLMDAIFDKRNFRNEVIWGYKTGGAPSVSGSFARKHDVILFYTKAKNNTFNRLKQISYSLTLPKPHTPSGSRLGVKQDGIGQYRETIMRDWWVEYGVNKQEDVTPLYRNNRERTKYPTQKPLTLLERIIKASSNEGDMVLDPFCGCATTCIAAEKLGRQWVGIDLSENAADLIYERLHELVDSPLADPDVAVNLLFVKGKEDLPKRTDLVKYDPRAVGERLFRQQGKKCAGCQKEFDDLRLMDKDHIIAKARGGQDVEENLQLLCRPCNVDKGAGTMEELRRKVQSRLLMERMDAARLEWEEKRKRRA